MGPPLGIEALRWKCPIDGGGVRPSSPVAMKISPLFPGILALALLAATGVRAEVEAFLQILTIPGESGEAAHSDWIDIEAFSFGARQSPAPGLGLFAAEFVVASGSTRPRRGSSSPVRRAPNSRR